MESPSELFWRSLIEYYGAHGRHDMPWRQPDADGAFSPYKILVSELMLQQTQVSRVVPKYADFLIRFPDVRALASVNLGEVLRIWSGLGYNRRAKYLWNAAQMVVHDLSGQFPTELVGLQGLPGVGPNTAGAIMAYAYDQPVVFVETNIRTVIIHHFFAGQTDVSDKAIQEVLTGLVLTGEPPLSPREFYWATMDYGSFLKKSVGNLNRASRSYTRQPTFHGSRRQLRGAIIRLLADGPQTLADIFDTLADDRSDGVVQDLIREGLVVQSGDRLQLG